MRKREPLKTATIGAVLVASLLDVHGATTTTFREGVNGYAGTQDTFISSGGPTTDNGADTTIEIDQEGDMGEYLLLRFENIFGSGAGQVPAKSKILFASLTVQITNTGNDPKVNRMLVPWKESDTWETLVDGILADDVEAAAVEDVTFPGNGSLTIIPLLVETLQIWSDGTKPNHGWVFLPSGTDGTDFSSSEHSNPENRPLLTIVWGTVDEPYVKSVSPLNGATGVPVDSNIQLVVVDGKVPQLNPNSVQLLVNSQSVKPTLDKPAGSNETTITYDPPANLPQNSKVPVRLIYADTATPPHVSTNDFSFTTRATTVTLFAIDDKQLWRYDRSGTDLGTAWKEKSFNDSAWPEGMALIGQEGTTIEPLRTPIERFTDAGDYIQTFYFRTHFNYAGPLGGDLFLRHMIDDGAVFYLNGVELHRFGLAAGATFDFLTSFGGHEHAYEGPFVIPGTALVTGDNVFAVEVHQSGTSSSDIVFGAELLVSTTPAAPPVVTPPPVTPPPSGGTLTTNIVIAIDDKQMWRYENKGNDLGTAWKEKAFNDSSWPQGAALLALETSATSEPIRTTLVRQNAAGVGIMTDYFRTHFTFTGDPATTKLSVRHLVDDGFVLYLNGTEVYRFGVAAGAVTATTAATSHEGRNIYEGPFDIPVTALVAGENVLAAEVHQTDAGSSDIVFGLELKAIASGAASNQALLVIGTASIPNLNPSDAGLKARLESQGWQVTVVQAPTSTTGSGDGKQLIITSSTVASGDVADKFRNSPVPVLNWEQAVQDNFLMTGDAATDHATTDAQTQINIVKADHPLAGGLTTGLKTVTSAPLPYSWGVPTANAVVIATIADNPTQALVYGYEKGAMLFGGTTPAPARRVMFFMGDDSFAALTPDGLKLFDAAVSWAANLAPKPAGPSLALARTATGLTVTFTGTLQSADAVTGPWTDVANAASPLSVPATGAQKFYRAKQ